MGLTTEPEHLPSDECVTFAAWQNLLLFASRSAEKDSTFDLAARNIARVLRAHPRGLGMLMLVAHEQRPPPEFAQRAAALIDRFRPQTLGIAVVVGAQGFTGAAQRAFSHGIIALTRMHGVLTLHGTSAEAAAFLSTRILSAEQRGPGAIAMRAVLGRFEDQLRQERGQGASLGRAP